MSFDFKLDTICTHQILLERIIPDASGYVRPISPLRNSNVAMWVNGVEVPRSGLSSPVSIISTVTGYVTITNTTNRLEITVDSFPQDIVITPGRVSIQQLSEDIGSKIQNAIVSVSNGHLVISSQYPMFLHNGSAHAVIGIPRNRYYYPKQLYSPWSVVADPNAIKLNAIKFSQVLHANDDVIEISYVTSADFCRRCRGMLVENDFIYSPLGEKVPISDEDLLLQEVSKAVLTIRGSNRFQPWYGTSIVDITKSKFFDFMKSQIIREVNNVAKNLRDIKVKQAQLQIVTPGEFPDIVQCTKVENDPNDSTILNIAIDIQSKRGGQKRINQLISLSSSYIETSGLIRRG
jgi:hypothetical protein